MNIEVDTLFTKAITALPFVANYTSKIRDGDYLGYVFLQPDWRRYEFMISAEQLATKQDSAKRVSTKEKQNNIEQLLQTEIVKIQQLIVTKNHQEQAYQLPLFTLPNSNWQVVEQGKASELANSLHHFVDKIDNHLALKFYSVELNFYKRSKLISFHQSDFNNQQKWLYFIEVQTDIPNRYNYYTLNGLSAPIHDCNTLIPIELTTHNVIDYLCFFCFFIQSEGGSFYIIPKVNDSIIPPVIWDEQFIHNNQSLKLLEKYKTPKVISRGKNSSIYQATMYFDCRISIVEMEIFPTGKVVLITSKDICSALPFRLEVKLT
ncbi:hypothetical protein Q4493_15475 [Colwellia sp. 1_MG-2023]|uniref:hypothetical protein n=1 Tax=Colwellia sp. 1_MG-2023 TaxID=3062649 RepID=UPI0026E40867|nr:hypothetical protein [Colwellia sp. 1_MG-2023]MDO6447171.1 hypothetical protein [Colwellia sp. 1_MG-2023]